MNSSKKNKAIKMLEDLTEDYHKEEFEMIAPYLTGQTEFPQMRIIMGVEKWFRLISYYVVEPYQKKDYASTQRHTVCEFFNTGKTFELAPGDLVDTFLIYKEETEGGDGLQFAAALVVFQVCQSFFVMITSVKVSDQRRRTGIGSAFFKDVAKYITNETKGKLYASSYMVVQQYQGLNPHGFYKKLGFVAAPSILDSWKVDGSDLAVCSIEQYYALHAVWDLEVKQDVTRLSQESLAVLDKGKSSHGDDAAPVHTTISQTRRGKHCLTDKCNGKLFPGKNWARHLDSHKRKDENEEIKFSYCSGIYCDACNQCKQTASLHHIPPLCTIDLTVRTATLHHKFKYQPLFIVEESKSPVVKKTKNRMSYYTCSICSEGQRQDQYTSMKKPLVCKPCINKKEGKRQGKKRPHTDTISESSYNPAKEMIKVQVPVLEENDMSAYREEEETLSKQKAPTKRQNTADSFISPTALNATAKDTRMEIDTTLSQGKATSSISQEQSGLATLSKALQIISRSKEEIVFLVSSVLDVCHLFVYDDAEQCIQTNKCTQLVDCIIKLIKRIDTLPQHKMMGLIAAAFIIGQSCWQSAMSALQITTPENRESLLSKLSLYMTTNYDIQAAKWFEQYWKYSTDHQIEICKYFKQMGEEVEPTVLTLSLAVQKSSIRDFVNEAQSSLMNMRTETCMILDHIQSRPAQPTLSFGDIRILVDLLSDTDNKDMVKKQQTQLEQSFIAQWLEILETAKTTVNIADAISIQHFLDELQAKYGDLTDLKDDITQSDDDRFAMILDSIDIKPNNKQFALAQYCVAKLYSSARQLWVVPSGQGKSRISAGIAMIALLCGSVSKIHMVFPNEELKERDRADFENLFLFVTEGDDTIVSYHVGIDFKPTDNALIIVDEADYFMFEDPPMFKLFVQNSPCICFTATPANSTVEQKVAAELKFAQYSYSLNDAAAIDKSAALMVDVNYKATTVEEKAAHIKELAKLTPVLVYCNEELTKAIVAAGIPPVMIEAGVDYTRLRQLDKLNVDTEHYTIIVSQQILGMRGFDYRSESIPMTLVIAKSFANKRDAVQGFNRVGRFGDKCSREKFTDVEIIDKTEETAQILAMFKFVAAMKKDQVVLKPVVVKPVTTKYKGKNAKRRAQLLQY